MATTKVRGMTIEIGGDTSGLNKSLQKVNSQVSQTQKSLKDVEKLLKLDPTNTELLAQKQELLKKNVTATESKLAELKKTEQEFIDNNGDTKSEQYMALKREIINTETQLQKAKEQAGNFNKELAKASAEMKEISSKAQDVADKTAGISRAAQIGLAGISAGVVKVVDNYADFEQLVGGVETLFKDSAETVKQYADEAYATAGLDANSYMETVTNFSASLISSLGGNTKKAAEVANMAIIDMADNANKMGTDMSSIENAYQGFAKQNYTMLDNLKLGYGGTKTEMERLLADAEKLSGVHYDISNLSDVYNAIHVIQTEIGITGTTAKEAEETISGSISMLKSAFDNFLTGLGQANADIDGLTKNLIDAFQTVVENIAPVLKNIWDNLPDFAKIAIAITAIVAVISPIAGIIASITATLADLMILLPAIKTALSGLSLSTMGWIGLAVAAITALVILIVKNWDTIKATLDALWSKIKDIGEKIKEKVLSVFDSIKQAFKNYINIYIGFINKFIGAINKMINGVNKVTGSINGALGTNIGQISQINEIPLLANGGVLESGSAIVGERGAELLSLVNGKAVVRPLTNNTTNNSFGGDTINYNFSVDSIETFQQIQYKLQNERRTMRMGYVR